MEPSTSKTPDPATKWATRWATIKDRLAIASVVVALLVLVFLMIDGSIENYRCRFWDFITFQCNRWDAREKAWE